jgi:hypothetical protein
MPADEVSSQPYVEGPRLALTRFNVQPFRETF